MKIAGLFSGIGGFELGMGAAGLEASLMCEIWPPAKAVLASAFPEVPIASDVTQIASLPEDVDVVVAGFPCQDLSQAGLTLGINGSRSGLVGHVFRLIDRSPVDWVVLENVSFMLHLAEGQAMARLVEAFEERGYRWAYRTVNSLAFLPQRRERIIFVATRSEVDPASILFVDDTEPGRRSTSIDTHAHGFYWTEGIRGLGWAPDAIPTLKNGSTVGIASPPAILLPTGDVVTPDIRDAERLQGFPPDWTLAAETVGRASLRWSLVGNAVSVPVARWIGDRLMRPGRFDTDRSIRFDGRRWPRAALFDGTSRAAVEIGAHPVWAERPPLVDFLGYVGKPLSARATRGFLSRTERSSLRFVPGFIERLHRHLSRMETADRRRSDLAAPAMAAE